MDEEGRGEDTALQRQRAVTTEAMKLTKRVRLISLLQINDIK